MRSLSTTLVQSLMEEEPFKYAHLVKFEKPIKTESGKSTRKATTYSYITDASIDVSYDDGSVDVRGVANGAQTYVANRLLDVSGISETIEARASNFSITLGASALNTTLSASFTIAGAGPYTITSNQNLVEAGFLEGDEIYISGGSPGWTGRIDRFVAASGIPNATAYVTLLEGTASSTATNIVLNTKDIGALLLPKTGSSYARYINREIFVYKAHINTNTGAIIGTPYLLFKGIITSGSLTEDVKDGSKMTWSISSHWGDWVRVNGRITSDTHHRALNNQGFSDREALIRPEYADDLGFLHSEQALNIMAVYKAKETRYKMKKSGLFGLKVKMKEYQVLVDREVDLRFNLEAKYLPVVYGVQRLDTIPFFVDTDKNDPSKVYAAYALCEGEIAGIYDIYFGDQSSVCLDKNDQDTRSSAPDGNIDVLCSGRADRGDVLKEQNVLNSASISLAEGFAFNLSNAVYYSAIMDRRIPGIDGAFSGVVQASPTSYGILHEKGRSFTDPIDCRFVVHTGKKSQAANNILVSKAQSNSFKVQGDYYTGDRSQYWGPNHRVLDTAYVVGEFTLSEGEEEIPEVEFIVKGKLLECHNYDYSYIHDPASTYSAETTASFQIGDVVTLNKTDTGSPFNTSATVADIYTDELGRTRVRFLNDPLLPVDNFYITGRTGSPGDPDYHLVATNYVVHSGTVAETLKQTVLSTSPVTPAGLSAKTYSITVSPSSLGNTVNLTDPRFAVGNISPIINLTSLSEETAYRARIVYGSSSGKGTGSTTTDIKGISSSTSDASYTTVISKNGIKLAAGASATNDFYNGYVIELNRTSSDGSVITQTRNVIDYDGTNKLAIVDEDWDPAYLPTLENSDTYRIYAPDDSRVSNNPAIQLLDYITSERYGRGLDIDTDINLETFKEAARKCDTRSDVTVVLASGTVAVGDIYEHTTTVSGNTVRIFKGTVSETATVNGLLEVTFTSVIGKLGKKWFDWKSYTAGDLIWNAGKVYRVTTTGTIPVGSLIPVNELGSVSLSKVSGAGGSSSTLSVNIASASFDGNPLVKKYVSFTASYISGYSLYDCDDVKYWRYVGWNSQDQSYVTRHQTNVIVNTSNSVFDNINMLLGHFNGIFRYNAGKYELDVEARHTATEGVYGYNEVIPTLTGWSTLNASIAADSTISGPTGSDGLVFKITEAATSPTSLAHGITSQPSWAAMPNNEVVVASAYFKAGTYSSAGLRILLKNTTATYASASFDLTGNGAYKIITASTTLAAGIYSVGSGWYRCWIAGNVGTGGTTPRVELIIDNTYADSTLSYSSSLATNYIYASGAKAEFYRGLDYVNGPTAYIYYPNIITEEDIIGAINIEDPGNKETFNTISVDIPDPRNRFEERSVTYFNSTYLIEDNNVPKKGDMKATGITNYFNARMNAKQYLEQSRYGLKISFTMPPKGVLITAGSIIEITNSRLGFVSKPFRVTNITINKDCLVQINADEHTNLAYLIGPSSGGVFAAAEPSTSVAGGPDALSSLSATSNQNGAIILSWTTNATFNSSTDAVEIYRSATSSFGAASKIAVVKYAETYTDVLNVSSSTTYWYWGRVLRESYKRATNSTTTLYSAYQPLSTGSGTSGTALSSLAVIYDVLVSAPVIFKDASTVGSPGTHTNISVSPTRTIGTTTSPFGFVTVTGNGDTEATTASPTITTTISNSAGKSTYTVRMYDTSTKINLLDSQVVPVVLKGDAGTSGTNPITAAYTNEAHVVPVTTAGLETWTNSGGLFYVYEGISPLTLNSNTQSTSYPSVSSPSQYNLDITFISGSTLTEPNITGAGTTTANISPWAGDLAGVTSYRLTAYIRSASGATVTRSIDATIAPSNQGATGADAVVYAIDTTAQVIFKDAATVGSPGTHTTAIISGTRTIGSVTSPYGFVTVTGNGDAEASPAQASITLAPTTTAGKTSYTVNLYNQATITGFSPIDTQSIPVIFKGATGASGVDPVVYAIDTTAQVIFKDAPNAATSGTHTTAIISGTRTIGSVTSPYGFVTVTGNGDAEASPAQASITLAPTSGAGKTSYTVKLYNQATITSFSPIDTQVIPIVFKGASGVDPVVYAIDTTAQVIFKDAATVGSPGTHTTAIISGTRTIGSVTSPYGFVTVTGNGDAEASPAQASITLAPTTTAGKTSYTINLYNQAIITGFSPIDTQSIPVIFKGATGASGVDPVVYAIDTNAQVIFKDAPNAATSGTHSSITVSGTRTTGSVTSPYGFVTITGNGDAETSPAQSSITLTPASGAGKTSYTVKLYNQATITSFSPIDTQVIPIVFKGASGVDPVVYAISTTAPVIVKDAATSGSPGVHTNITVSGTRTTGSVTSPYGFVTITGNGDAEASPAAASITTSISNTAGKTSYTVNLYNQATITGFSPIDSQVIPIVFKGTSGSDGAAGANAITTVLSNEAHVFPASNVGAVSSFTGSGTQIRVYEGGTLLTYSPAGTGNGMWAVSTSPVNITVTSPPTNGGTVATYADYSGVAAGTDTSTIEFNVTGKTTTGVSFTASKVQKLSKSKSGTGGITATLSNEAHVFPASNIGAVTSYTGSGTQIRVYEGGTLLTYSPAGTGNGMWAVSSSPINITVVSPPANGGTVATYADYTTGVANGTDISTVEFNITGKTTAGTSFTTSKIQSFSKSKTGVAGSDPVVYAIDTTAEVIFKDAATVGSPGTHTTAIISGTRTIGSVTSPYGFVTVTGNGDAEASPAQASITLAPTTTAGKTSYTVSLYNQATITGFSPIDTQVIPVIFKGASGTDGTAGANAITAVLSNEAHVFPASNIGAVTSYTGSGSQIRVYEGGNLLTYSPAGTGNGMWAVSTSPVNITVSSPPTNGGTVATYGNHSAVANGTDTSSVEYNITGKTTTGVSFTASKVQKLSKSKSGTGGVTAVLSNEAHVFPASNIGAVTSYTGSGTQVRVYEGGNLLTYSPAGTGNGMWAVSTSPVNITVVSPPANGGTVATYADYTTGVANGTDISTVEFNITGKTTDGTSFTTSKIQSFSKSKTGVAGSDPVVYAIDTTAQVIFKDAATVGSPGTHTTAIISGTRTIGSVTSPYGFVTVTGNGDAEASPAQASITLAPTTTAGKTSYTVSLYNQATITGFSPIDTQVIPIIFKGTSGTDGTAGANAITAVLSNEAHVFPASNIGAVTSYTGSGSQIRVYEGGNLLTYSPAGTGNGMWAVSTSPVNITVTSPPTNGGTVATYGNHSAVSNGTDTSSVEYNITGKTTAGVSFTASKVQKLSKSKSGTGGVTAVLSNEAHVFPASNIGAVTSYTGSGTQVRVYEGGTVLTYSPAGTGNGMWAVSTSPVNITVVSPPANGGTVATYADYTTGVANGTDISTVEFNITGKTTDGTSFTTSKIQSFSKSKTGVAGSDPVVYAIDTTAQVIFKDAATVGSPGTHTTAIISGTRTIGSVTSPYGFVTVTGNGDAEASPAQASITLAPTTTAGKTSYTVKLYNQATITSFSPIDTQVIPIIFKGTSGTDGTAGANAITAVLSNEAHVLPSSNTGAVTSYGNSGTQVRVYEGGNLLTYSPAGTGNGMWAVSTSPVNITVTSPPTNGGTVATYGNHSAVANGTDTSTVEYNITGKTTTGVSFTATKVQKLSKSKSGTGGVTAVLSNEAHVFPATTAGAVTSYTGSGSQVRVYEGGTLLTYSPAGTGNGMWAVSTSPVNITVVSPPTNGGTVATYADYSGVANGTDTSTVEYNITGKTTDGVSFTTSKIQNFSKSKTGTDGAAGANSVVAVLSKDSHVFPASPDGTVTNYTGATTDVRVYEGATELVYSPAATKNGRWTVSASPINITAPAAVDNGTYATYTYTAGVAAGTDTSSASYTITGKTSGGTSFTLVKVQSFSKSKIGTSGTNGSPAVSAILTRPSASVTAYANGVVKASELPIGGTFKIYKGSTDVTTSATFSSTVSPAGGLTGSVSPSGATAGIYNITAVSPTIDSGSLNLSAVYEGITYTAQFSVSKNRIGFEIVSSPLPTTDLFEGRMVFLSDNDKLYRYTGTAWTAAVDGGDISPGTLAATAFASNIKPVEIVSSPLPTTGLVDGRIVFLTNDKKLYRYSTAIPGWTKSTDGADIVANSITAGQIQAGAIGATQIAAGAITTNKLAVSSSGFNLTRDPAFSDSTAWYKIEGNGAVTFESSPSLAPPFGTTFAKVVNSAGTSPDSGAAFTMGQSGGGNDRPFPITTGRRYKVSIWIRTTSTSARHYVRVYWYDANTTLNTTSATLTAVSPNITVSENFTLTAANTWQRFTWHWDAPANAVSALPRVWGCWNASPNTSYFNDFRVEEFIGGELVVDGTIKGTKIEADSITANQIAVGAITAAEIAANAITADKVSASAITSRELAISNTSPAAPSATGIFMDSSGTGPKIDIFDGGVLRVRLGRLS
jgi:hypothetical protein